jgi:hypothetical protein
MELPQVPAPAPRCIHLMSNSMSIHGTEFESDQGDRSGSTHSTCVKTGRALGPDYAATGHKACSDPDRDCYEEY